MLFSLLDSIPSRAEIELCLDGSMWDNNHPQSIENDYFSLVRRRSACHWGRIWFRAQHPLRRPCVINDRDIHYPILVCSPVDPLSAVDRWQRVDRQYLTQQTSILLFQGNDWQQRRDTYESQLDDDQPWKAIHDTTRTCVSTGMVKTKYKNAFYRRPDDCAYRIVNAYVMVRKLTKTQLTERVWRNHMIGSNFHRKSSSSIWSRICKDLSVPLHLSRDISKQNKHREMCIWRHPQSLSPLYLEIDTRAKRDLCRSFVRLMSLIFCESLIQSYGFYQTRSIKCIFVSVRTINHVCNLPRHCENKCRRYIYTLICGWCCFSLNKNEGYSSMVPILLFNKS